jgi:hypothetical protein
MGKWYEPGDIVMKPEFPRVDQDRMVSPHAQEVEYALILSRMINTVKEDPSQLRLTIYEFARARLNIDTSWADEAERKRLSAALETAIQGVEEFSVHREEREQLRPPVAPAQIGSARSPAEPPPSSMPAIHQASPAPEDILVPNRVYLHPKVQPIVDVRARSVVSTLARSFIGVVLFAMVAGLALYKQRTGLDSPSQMLSKLVSPQTKPAIPETPQQAAAPVDPKIVAASPSPLPFPVPSDYGIYALSNSALSELYLLPERVPDKRIVMSTPVDQPSRTTLPDGKAKFVIFRRDLAGNAPERMEVRVVARVMRALTFDAKGKPTFSPISEAWNIRNVSYEFRVRPIAGNPEMLLVQPDKADFELPAGRYVLVLRDQGYDFTVAGKVTEPSQCVERTDAANGTFYSECQKQ